MTAVPSAIDPIRSRTGDRKASSTETVWTRGHPLERLFRLTRDWPPVRAAVVFTSLIVLLAEGLTHLLWWALFGQVPAGTAAVTALMSVAVTGPLTWHVQNQILRLNRSKLALRRLTETLATARNEAEAANRAKSDFLAHMSHELRTPLNAIIGFSEIIRDDRLRAGLEKYREYAADIHLSGTHLLQIINDLLDLAKIESGKMTIEEELIDLQHVMRSTVQILTVQSEERDLRVAVHVPDHVPLFCGSPRMMRQILLNLMSNAVKFTPQGGEVDVRVEMEDDGSLNVIVADTGIGMTRKGITVALTPFGQVDNALVRRQGGTGLGLPLTRAMVELHGGRLDIFSVPGQGTTVRAIFPPHRTRWCGARDKARVSRPAP